MRIFHMADLHIGKKLNNISLIEDQRVVLDQVLRAIETQHPDVLVLAGDIYDRRNPPIEAVNLLDDFLSEVVLVRKVPVVAIGGNHDSGERLGFANGILAKAGLHLVGRLSVPVPKVILTDQWGEVHFHLLPYADLATIKHELGQADFDNYQEAMSALLALIAADRDVNARHVLVAHGVVVGAEPPETSDSERELTIGGTEYWSSELLGNYAYVALGHLHRAQRAGAEQIRYAGSLLKYSFSEEKQQKNIVQVDLDAQGQVLLTLLPLVPWRDLRTITGELQSLLHPSETENTADFIRAILTDRGEVLEPMAALRGVYPNTVVLERADVGQAAPESELLDGVQVQSKTPEALFGEFYEAMTTEPLTEQALIVMQQVFKTAKEAE